MQAVEINIAMDQGSDFSATVSVFADEAGTVPFDLTNYTPTSQIRGLPSDSFPMATFTASIHGSPTDGKIDLSMPASATSKLTPGRAFYDVKITRTTGEKFTAVKGGVDITAQVTR